MSYLERLVNEIVENYYSRMRGERRRGRPSVPFKVRLVDETHRIVAPRGRNDVGRREILKTALMGAAWRVLDVAFPMPRGTPTKGLVVVPPELRGVPESHLDEFLLDHDCSGGYAYGWSQLMLEHSGEGTSAHDQVVNVWDLIAAHMRNDAAHALRCAEFLDAKELLSIDTGLAIIGAVYQQKVKGKLGHIGTIPAITQFLDGALSDPAYGNVLDRMKTMRSSVAWAAQLALFRAHDEIRTPDRVAEAFSLCWSALHDLRLAYSTRLAENIPGDPIVRLASALWQVAAQAAALLSSDAGSDREIAVARDLDLFRAVLQMERGAEGSPHADRYVGLSFRAIPTVVASSQTPAPDEIARGERGADKAIGLLRKMFPLDCAIAYDAKGRLLVNAGRVEDAYQTVMAGLSYLVKNGPSTLADPLLPQRMVAPLLQVAMKVRERIDREPLTSLMTTVGGIMEGGSPRALSDRPRCEWPR